MINLPLPVDNFEGDPSRVVSISDFVQMHGERIIPEVFDITNARRHMEESDSNVRHADSWGHIGGNIANVMGHTVETPLLTPQQNREPRVTTLEYVATPVPENQLKSSKINAPVTDLEAARARVARLNGSAIDPLLVEIHEQQLGYSEAA